MKTFQILFACLFLFAGISNAQTVTKKTADKTSTFKVWGNCGMCKTTIEGAAKTSGATYANWNMESKMLTVKYAAAKTNDEKIQKGIANAGYDNVKYTAPDAAYEGLHECCKYDRKVDATAKGEKGAKEACCVKDGKCTGTMDCCKKMDGKSDCCVTGKCAEKDGCCADMKCDKEGDCCKKGSKDAGACCMKDGKCVGGKECCKKMEGKSDCCATGKCAEKDGCCGDMKCEKDGSCCKKDGVAKMDCCNGKEGKCSHK